MVRSVECTDIRILNLSELIDDTADKTANNTKENKTCNGRLDHMPAQRELPPIISYLPSYRHA